MNYKEVMDKWKDWRLGETPEQILAETIENETSLPFKMMGNNSLTIQGKKLSVKLVFSGNDLKQVVDGKKKQGKVVIASVKYAIKYIIKFIKSIPSILKYLGKWIIDAIKESIAQIFTLLGFFIAWFTLTGSAQDIVGIAIIVSTVIWLLTIYIREE